MTGTGSRAAAGWRSIPAALLLAGAVAAPAAAASIYAADVSVALAPPADQAARDAALQHAQELALDRVLHRLTATRSHAALPTASGPNVVGYVEAVTVLAEGEDTLRARVTIREDAVHQLLAGLGIAYAAEAGPGLVVVPVYLAGGDPVLWSGPNPWLDAWSAYASDAALVPITVPYGEFGDLQVLSTAEATAGDAAALAAMSARYETAGSVVAVYQPQDGHPQDGQAQVRLSVRAEPDWAGTTSLAVPLGTAVSAETIATVMAAIDRLWVERQIRPSYDGPVSSIGLTAVFGSLQDWIAIRHTLDGAAVVDRFDVPVVSGHSAQVVLYHYASLATVQADLAAAGLIMEPGSPTGLATASLILRLADAPPAYPQPGYATAPAPGPFQGAPAGAWPAPLAQPAPIAPIVPTLRYQP